MAFRGFEAVCIGGPNLALVSSDRMDRAVDWALSRHMMLSLPITRCDLKGLLNAASFQRGKYRLLQCYIDPSVSAQVKQLI